MKTTEHMNPPAELCLAKGGAWESTNEGPRLLTLGRCVYLKNHTGPHTWEAATPALAEHEQKLRTSHTCTDNPCQHAFND